MMRQLVLLAMMPCAIAFTAPSPSTRLPMQLRQAATSARATGLMMQQKPEAGESSSKYAARLAATAPFAALLSQAMLPVQEAAAAGGKLGLLEGKAVAMIHPLTMLGLFVVTLFTGYQGLMWRQLRELGDELKPIDAELKALQAKADAVAEGESVDSTTMSKITELKAKSQEITAKRKEMVAGDYKNKHFTMASALLALGVTISIEGGCDTYMRTGKLFPGPHLFAGAGITVLWAVAAALVPAMQKGDNNARTLHIGINTAILGLFAWQIPTGLEITGKVIEKVAWVPVVVEAVAK